MTAIVDTTRTGGDLTRSYPPLLVRRILARAIDSVVGLVLACAVVLPFTFSRATDALVVGGFDSIRDFFAEWSPGTVTSGSVGVALEQLEPVVLGAVYLQALVIWAYDWLSHTLTGSSIGKAIARVRVTRHRTGPDPTTASALRPSRSGVERALRMGLRSALVVGPPALAAGTLVAAAFAVPGAADVAEMFIALTVVLLITWLAGGVGLHGLATGTRVVGFEWQELRHAAEHQLETHRGSADAYLRTLQGAAQTSSASAENDPRLRTAAAKGRALAAQGQELAQEADPAGRLGLPALRERLRAAIASIRS